MRHNKKFNHLGTVFGVDNRGYNVTTESRTNLIEQVFVSLTRFFIFVTTDFEFSNNGVDNDISHTRGTISMARASDPDSASSQFFIVQADSTFLDGDYAGFGHVTEGMDIVDKICEDAKPTDDNGTIPSDQQPVIEKITITD
jgi:cyclophilin family peptidyl-prolyl cis-trans isomerase